MRRLLLSLVALVGLSAVLGAQIYVVRLTDEKAAKRYKKAVIEMDGGPVILGEAVPGGGISFDGQTVHYRGPSDDPRVDDSNQLWLLDRKDPEAVPYIVRGGKKETRDKKKLVTVSGSHIDKVQLYMPSEDIASLAREYLFRAARIDEVESQRDEQEKGSTAWFAQHQLLLTEIERLVSWLDAIVFQPAARKLEKRLAKESKVVAQQARQKRVQRALASVHDVDTPDALTAACETLETDLEFHVQESQHLRIVYMSEIGDERVANLLSLCEQVIDGFRTEFVDPFLAPDFEDRLPDGIFQEFWFGPQDPRLHDRFLTAYCGISWGPQKALMVASKASKHNLTEKGGPEFLHYSWYEDIDDLEGESVHILGHALAALHFNGGDTGMNQIWIEEGLGVWLSFEYFGRNTMACFETRVATYMQPNIGEAGEKSVLMGLRATFNRMALDLAPRLDKLTLKFLFDFEDPDVAKSWSFFDFVVREMRADGQRWMRACCEAARDRATFHKTLRPITEQILGVTGEDALRVLDDRWREFAENQQDVSED